MRREGERELLVGAGMVLRHLQDSGIALFLIQKEKGESLKIKLLFWTARQFYSVVTLKVTKKDLKEMVLFFWL